MNPRALVRVPDVESGSRREVVVDLDFPGLELVECEREEIVLAVGPFEVEWSWSTRLKPMSTADKVRRRAAHLKIEVDFAS